MFAKEITYPDEELLRLIKNGDKEAFASFYRRYWEQLFVTAVKVIRCKEDAADIVQEIFLSIWNRRAEIQIAGSITAYLQTSVRYKAIHYIEKNITRRNYLSLLGELAETQSASSPEAIFRMKEIEEAMHEVVDQMPPKMREVYLLSRQKLLTHKQIAERIGISEETVKKHIQRAMQFIKSSMGKAFVTLVFILFR